MKQLHNYVELFPHLMLNAGLTTYLIMGAHCFKFCAYTETSSYFYTSLFHTRIFKTFAHTQTSLTFKGPMLRHI
jgi:hypothetical protein